MTIDPNLLPGVALVDTGFLILALGDRPDDVRAQDAAAVFRAMRDNGRLMLVAAPSFAEYERGVRAGTPSNFPRGPHIVVVPFDSFAAKIMAERFPASAMKARKDAHKTSFQKEVWTCDAMIIACAVRHRAECIIGFDAKPDFVEMVKAVNMPLLNPREFRERPPEPPTPLPILREIELSKAREQAAQRPPEHQSTVVPLESKK